MKDLEKYICLTRNLTLAWDYPYCLSLFLHTCSLIRALLDICFLVPVSQVVQITRPRGYKTFFVLNSIEHEILNAHKYNNIKKFCFILGSDKPRMLFFLLIYVKMPTVVGILTFMSRKNFMLS